MRVLEYLQMIIPNLTTHMIYEVKVQAASLSVINHRRLVLGTSSTLKTISMQPNCDKMPPKMSRKAENNDYDVAMIAAIVFSCFGIMLIVVALVLWR